MEPIFKGKNLKGLVCDTCKAITSIHGKWVSSKCRECRYGGKYFQHYALAVIVSGIMATLEDIDHLMIKTARLDKTSILSARDMLELAQTLNAHCGERTQQPNKPRRAKIIPLFPPSLLTKRRLPPHRRRATSARRQGHTVAC